MQQSASYLDRYTLALRQISLVKKRGRVYFAKQDPCLWVCFKTPRCKFTSFRFKRLSSNKSMVGLWDSVTTTTTIKARNHFALIDLHNFQIARARYTETESHEMGPPWWWLISSLKLTKRYEMTRWSVWQPWPCTLKVDEQVTSFFFSTENQLEIRFELNFMSWRYFSRVNIDQTAFLRIVFNGNEKN